MLSTDGAWLAYVSDETGQNEVYVLGPYQIESPLGAGGMGEVYRARDTKLDRDVALKVLPQAFTDDPDRLARSASPERAADTYRRF